MKGIGWLLCAIVAITTIAFISKVEGYKEKVTKAYSQSKEKQQKMFDKTYTTQKSSTLLSDLSNKNSICVYNTLNSPKSSGLNIDVYYYCNWQEFKSEDIEPIRLKSYQYYINDTVAIGVSIDIEPLADTFTTTDINRYRSQFFQEIMIAGAEQEYISSINKKINAVPASEIISFKDSPKDYSKFLHTHIYYKGKIISIVYVVNTNTKKLTTSTFEKYKKIFSELANKTVIKRKLIW
jgi:hypothetical protein